MGAATIVLHAALIVAGIVIVIATWRSLITTIILPRATVSRVASLVWLATYYSITALALRRLQAARRDSLLALMGPLNILFVLFVWMAGLVVGYGLIFWGITGDRSVGIDLGGSSVLTLGFATPPPGLARFVSFAGAISGMFVIALQVGYLPVLYGAYTAREALVTMLRARCGAGTIDGASVLAAHPLPGDAKELAQLFGTWELACAQIAESHVSYPWLIVFRSPRIENSWVVSMLAILDAAALVDSIAPSAAPREAHYVLTAGSMAFRNLARILLPRPKVAEEHHRSISRADYAAAIAPMLAEVAPERSIDEGYAAFEETRSRYIEPALEIGYYIRLHETTWLQTSLGQLR
jgi:hypothetical protein